MKLTTDRLCVRPLTPGDFDALAALYDDPEVMRFSLGRLDREQTREKLDKHIRLQRDRDLGTHALETHDGRFVGICGFQPQVVDDVEEIEIGYRLRTEFWGHGLATEASRAFVQAAFDELGLARVIAIIEPENPASIRVAEKAGLSFEKETEKWDRKVRIYVATSAADLTS